MPSRRRIVALLVVLFPVVTFAQEFNPFEQGQDTGIEALLNPTVETASQQAEPLSEAPVPVTVISSEMIRAIGARNLQEVLITYVPGMTMVTDHNEMNVAMRGVYASSQQKILILLDGHRLNSRAYSMANPDYSISIPIDKVKQIEVLRGPGSSLYGNVALTAVVNVVTRDPGDLNGVSVSLLGGEYISAYDEVDSNDTQWLRAGRGVNIVYGKDFGNDTGLLMWGSVFRADGQRLHIAREDDYSATPQEGYAILGGVSGPPSYDVGMRYETARFSVLANTRYGKVSDPFTASGALTGEVYNYDGIRSFQTLETGLGSRSDHIQLKYSIPLTSSVTLGLVTYYDRNDLSVVLTSNGEGGCNFLNWNDDDVGGGVTLRYDYNWGGWGNGNMLFGVETDVMRLLDSVLTTGADYEWTGFADTQDSRVLETGHEVIVSSFVQVKHRLFDQLVINVGARFDGKDRHRGKNVYNVSPRLAAVWTPNDIFNLKFSFAQSFVDAPYWYRYNSLGSYQGAENLTPENLRSIQVSPTVSLLGGKLVNTLNFYYNHLYDFVYRDPNAGVDDPKYLNAGMLKSIGVEDEIAYVEDSFNLRANVSYQREIDAQDFGASGGRIDNIPPLAINLIGNVRPLWKWNRNVLLNMTARITTEQRSPILNTYRWNATTETADPYSDENYTVPAQLHWNIGLRLTDVIVKNFDFDFTVYNVLDNKQYQGGSVKHPYPQPGRLFMVNLTYRAKHKAPPKKKEAGQAEAVQAVQ